MNYPSHQAAGPQYVHYTEGLQKKNMSLSKEKERSYCRKPLERARKASGG